MKLHRLAIVPVVGFFALSAFAGAPGERASAPLPVTATIETEPVSVGGDAADDPSIWINPANPAESTIIATNKQGGLLVYDLSGKQLQYLPVGRVNNVDLRSNVAFGGQKATIVTSGNRDSNTIEIYKVNPATRLLENVAARKIVTTTAYGACMYLSKTTGKLYYFVASKAGDVEQWELFEDGKGKMDGKRVRAFKVGSVTEGCVADDELGHLYVSEEAVGIWKYGAEPEAGASRVQIDTTGPNGHLTADVEGLAIAYGRDGKGYLLVSSQGNATFVVYRREDKNAYVKTFAVVDGTGVDGVAETDGIDVTTTPLGDKFPNGVFVAQDGFNDKGNQNFKLVPWESIASSLE